MNERAGKDGTDDVPKAAMDVLYSYLMRELPDVEPAAGIARDILYALRGLPVADRMEAMGMERIGWTSLPYGSRHVLDEQQVATLDARADNDDATFRGTFSPVYREAPHG
jgi:hypothetical protein